MLYFQIKSSGNWYVINNALIWKGSVQKLHRKYLIYKFKWLTIPSNYFRDEILLKNNNLICIDYIIFVHSLSIIAYDCEWDFH